jgi:hypothetical protein
MKPTIDEVAAILERAWNAALPGKENVERGGATTDETCH